MNAHVQGCVASRDAPRLPRARPARSVLRPHRHRLAAPQDPGRVLPGGRLAHLRAPDPVRGGRDDLRRAALCHRDHRRARSRRARRRERRARPHRGAVARAAARYPPAVPGRLLPVRGHQARSVARGACGCRRRFLAGGARPELFRQRNRDDVHARRGCLPRLARSRTPPAANGRGPAL